MNSSALTPYESSNSIDPRNALPVGFALSQPWFDACGQGPFSLAQVGRLVRQKPETASHYQSVDGTRFADVCSAAVLESLADAKQWDLLEQIMGIDVEAMAKELASRADSPKNLQDPGNALRELSVI